ncbi:Ubiquitin-related modifier 1 [Taphrina deformans PYCC 5710]|uniref:Ubiquitin-related modifier 1 n=1 Tax=Taphrina deformans (strain PYCC 5710 / ATCC 11124 / CBS 356.35 / IMI 108563 / JCM 9778 / NBRC 8474) TaxID=1097556 RepID=R4XD12_TAPDE|nr:Ubiquitin-related modifier 1 [Taphrina deformans PYCC 5710]|eukprot:CCG82298.1 Ubiquitin-related modifier 1 [Taphrina deformans PYCC 5710]
MLNIRIALTGGLELIFQNRRHFKTQIETGATLSHLITNLQKECQAEKQELFVQNGTVRPGILVLINDSDWELEGEGEYVLQNNDEILFVSTLHGG